MAKKWIKHAKKPAFNGQYLVRAVGSDIESECSVIDADVFDDQGAKILNLGCEWLRIGACKTY